MTCRNPFTDERLFGLYCVFVQKLVLNENEEKEAIKGKTMKNNGD